MWGKGSSRGNGDGFFSSRCKIEGNPALPLGFIEDGVHYLKGDHLTVHLHPSFLAHLLNVTPNNRSFDFETEEICIGISMDQFKVYFNQNWSFRGRWNGLSLFPHA